MFAIQSHFAEKVEIETVKMEDKNHDDDKHEKRHQFAHRADDVEGGCLFGTAQYDEVECPNQHGAADNGPYGVAAREIGREEVVEGVHGNDGIPHIAEDLAEPVGPGDKKTGEGTEAYFPVHIDARGEVGARVGKDAEGVRQKEHAEAGDDPCDDDRSHRGGSRHVLRQAVNTAADHGTDYHAGEGYNAQFFCVVLRHIFLPARRIAARSCGRPPPKNRTAR